MIRVASIARWTAIGIGVAAIWDPAVPLPHLERPAIRVLPSAATGQAVQVSQSLRAAGFVIDAPQGEVAQVVVGDRFRYAGASKDADAGTSKDADAGTSKDADAGTSKDVDAGTSKDVDAGTSEDVPYYVIDTSPRAPNVAVARASAPDVRLPEQAIDVRVTLDAAGVVGQTTELVIEDAGIPVASATHQWTNAHERWTTSLQYLPPGAAGGRLRIRAVPVNGETAADDNAADVPFPPMRGPVRTLVVEAGVTWPALFVRRALEGEPAFAVSAVQRASKNIATRAGSPPAVLTRATLAPYEVALVGGPDNLAAADLESLRWFVEERGGVVAFVPDQRPAGRYVDLTGVQSLELRTLEEAVRLRGVAGDVLASELLVPRTSLPVRVLAATATGEPVVFAARRGSGAVIFSGALDAWRYRGLEQDAFARFWRRAIADEATTVPPALDVSVTPAIVRPGETIRVRARIRTSDLPANVDRLDVPAIAAHAASPAAHVDAPVRLWPTAEPGVYAGEWRAPVAGDYNVSVTAPRLGSGQVSRPGSEQRADLRGDAVVTVAPAVTHGSTADPESLALAARASGGQVFTADRSSALVGALRTAFPPRRVIRTSHPMRSPWWVVSFALLLSTEWAMRRRMGMA
jgi:hypothetical protein